MRILKSFLLVIGLIILIQGCGRPPEVMPPAPGIPLKDICARYNVQWQWDGVTQVVMLEYKGNKAKALVGSNTVLLGKDKILLSAPLRRQNSTIFVPDDFESKVLAPFGISVGQPGSADLTFSKVRTIVLDPGHGGRDPGAKGITGLLEKDVTLDIAKRLRSLLETQGFKIIMTRDSDDYPTLNKRTEITSKSNADIFVSIHANSNPNRKTQGIEVYYVKTQNKHDLDEEQRQKNERSFSNRLNASNSSTINSIVADMMYNHKVSESTRLARSIAAGVSGEAEAYNRGALTCRFFVVRNTLIPAVLVEVGYLTNRQEERRLKSPAYRQKLAEGISRSIVEYALN